MKNFRLRLQALCLSLVLCVATMSAQEIRYVTQNGAGSKNGSSWDNAYSDVQAAINDLVNNNKTGEVWVAAGKYYPTESTESSSSQYYKSFKIPAGITVRGGFAGTESYDKATEDPSVALAKRKLISDKNFGSVLSSKSKSGNLDGESAKSGVYQYKTILCGDLNNGKQSKFEWKPDRNQFDVTFYGNSYHVVWFAMNGFNASGRANPLSKPAKLEGCVVEGGHAYNSDAIKEHPHSGYGGGIYMVANSFVYNCEVRNCDASRNGGGIYMDGGGIVRRTYVHDCQTLGLGTEFGLGGGICENGAAHNSKSNPIVVAQSVVTNCVARMGGGMALLADQTIGNAKYTVVANSTLVNNNTAQIEAGGVYTYKGGGIASLTIVNNKCYGSGVTQNNVITGRSGGLYSRDAAYVANSVIWGNVCDANKDVQYASSRTNLGDSEKSKFYYNAVSKSDYTDWSGSTRLGVLSLADHNNKDGDEGSKGYPIFFKPTTSAGYLADTDAPIDPSEDNTDEKIKTKEASWTNWTVSSESFLTHAGIATVDLDNEELTPAPAGISYDMQFGQFNSRPTLGAFISQVVDIAPVPDVSYNGVKYDYVFFVDPDFIYPEDHDGNNGINWEFPARFLGNVLDYIKTPRPSYDGTPAPNFTDKTIAVFVKEGTVDNTRTAGDSRIRVTSLEIPSNVSLFGSFDSKLTGTNLSQRNPVLTPTVISAKLMDDYKYNVAHLIKIDGKENITIDGFKLSFANANSTELSNSDKNGAAITLTNCLKHEEDHDANIHFKNITVSNCFGDKGTVVYADNSWADFENCIFHNNTTATLANSGLVYGINNSNLRFDHCNVLRSVGHASYLDATTKNSWNNSMFYGNLDRPQDNTNNCNTFAIAAFDGPGVNATSLTGERCMFDLVSRPLYDSRDSQYSSKGISGINLGAGIPDNSTYYVRNTYDIENGVNQTTESNLKGLEYEYHSGWANGYPRMVNPTKNAGYSTEGDITYYGRATSFEPHNDNPVVNAATTSGEPHSARQWGKDITTVVTRDFGGLPDIGAVESHIASSDQIANENGNPDGQMPYGVAYYVRDYAQTGMPMTYKLVNGNYVQQKDANLGKGNYVDENGTKIFLDGASWQYAVSGNADYSGGTITARDVNTTWEATRTESETFSEKFYIHSSNNYLTINVSSNGRTITLATTTDITQAVAWSVSGVSTEDGIMSGSSHTLQGVASNGSKYFVYITSSSVSASTTSRNLTLTGSNNNFTIRYNTNNYLRLSGTTLSRSTSATSWTFTPMMNKSYGPWTETCVAPTDVTPTDRTPSTSNGASVSNSLDIHVYSSIEDINNLGAANVVTYKIKLQGSDSYVYDNGTYHYMRTTTNASTGNTFALISAGKEDLYYIYDVTTSRYVYNYGSGNYPVRTGSEAQRTLWRITQDANNSNAFNITIGTEPLTDNLRGWNAGSYVTYASRSGNANQEWVLVAQKDYTNKYYQVETSTAPYLNGLQYAVNTVYDEFVNNGEKHQVHVAHGTYTNATPADGANTVQQPYAYMMKEGVDVLGGYPTVGNPGEDQRQPKVYETILQPQSGDPFVTMSYKSKTGTRGNLNDNPDIMQVSSWGANAKQDNAQDQASVGRVLVQPSHFNVKTAWDGFTVRYGYLNTSYMYAMGDALTRTSGEGGLHPDEVKVAGGAGVLLQGNGMLVNSKVEKNLIICVPTRGSNNTSKVKAAGYTDATGTNLDTYNIAAAGVFMTGDAAKTATLENCEIGSNQSIMKAVHVMTNMPVTDNYGTTSYHTCPDHLWVYGAGLFQNGGNVYNTIIHDNFAGTIQGSEVTAMNASVKVNNEMLLGAGAFVAKGNFYNNTVVNNKSCSFFHCHNNHCTFAGVHVFDEARIYNTIVADNESYWGYKTWNSASTSPGNGVPVSAFKDNESVRTSRDPDKVHVFYSFINVEKGKKDNNETEWVDLTSGTTSGNGNTNIYINSNLNANWDQTTYTDDKAVDYRKYYTRGVYNMAGAGGTTTENIYRLIAGSPCINTGTEDIIDAQSNAVNIPDFDAGYDDRVQDCRIDIGAYESNGRASIASNNTADKIIFYVTPEGKGSMNGSDPENAACAAKLQMVLDAAGRAKLAYPGKQVIVKVANSYDLYNAVVKANNDAGKKPGDDGYEEPTNFTYYATRTTDQNSTDTRMWSIQIPRGVEVEGGYTDKNANGNSWSNAENGFQTRDITGNPTYFDSYFYNKDMKINATTYHVVTFTERVFDADGNPFMYSDYFDAEGNPKGILPERSSYNASQLDEALFLHMSDVIPTSNVIMDGENPKNFGTAQNPEYASNRAVLDGIFVTGGNADGKSLSGSSNLNANGYGGAAIVTEYAYVRNCIVMNNSATNGGAFALTNGALVSGSLIIENNADNMGGGLYVFENGATLSNGVKINSDAPEGQPMDYNMAHVLTSTIAANTAQMGGGIWFSDDDEEANARFNSVAIWQNYAANQANVFGAVNPEQPFDDETISEVYYPFAYSVIQNLRASGTNNISIDAMNDTGARFVEKTTDVGQAVVNQKKIANEDNSKDNLAEKLANFGFYGLTTYSSLINAGMPVTLYDQLKKSIAISDVDILNVDREQAAAGMTRTFIEAGARALAKGSDGSMLMLRLFVAQDNDVNMSVAKKIMDIPDRTGFTEAQNYYAQEGSSFAYPFNRLQDALDYIRRKRNEPGSNAANLPFEILVGRGIYYPKMNLNEGTESVWGATFAIPEGVTIIGGFNPQGGDGTYYGRYYAPNGNEASMTDGNATTEKYITANVNPIPQSPYTPAHDATAKEIGRGYNCGTETVTINGATLNIQQWHILDIADRRAMKDNNSNGIVEPWEFMNQTIISGNAVNGETDGVYHVMTAVADEDAVGKMPKASLVPTGFTEDGYHVKEQGQPITLNGIVVTGGNALTYLSTALDDYGSYIFYQGAGLQVDGNRYKNNKNDGGTNDKPTFHNSAAYGVGYRDIPVNIVNCQFRNNIAGYGGAISSNGSLAIYGSSFEQNLAIAQTERPDAGETWKSFVNDQSHSGEGQTVDKVMYPGQGGAILATRQLSVFNTLFANNEARLGDGEEMTLDMVKHPTFRVPVENNAIPTLRAAGGAIVMGSAAQHHIVNCDFVRNKANMYPAVFTMNPTYDQSGSIDTHNYSQIINTVAWGNEVSDDALAKAATDKTKYAAFPFASKLMVNVGKKLRKHDSIIDAYSPAFTADAAPVSQEVLDGIGGYEKSIWQEAVWFSAYESGVGFTPNNRNDLRELTYSTSQYAIDMIKNANNSTYQNCNILIVSDNSNLAGPNFGNPSVKAGFDGFMEGADWSPARFNRLTDNGNGWIKQEVTAVDRDKNGEDDDVNVDFLNVKNSDGTYQGAYSVTHYLDQFPDYQKYIALGSDKYMQSVSENVIGDVTINGTPITTLKKNLSRISEDPTLNVHKAYIDIGVYEYMKQPLLLPGGEVDVLWVSTKENPGEGPANGATWKTPTSDLQRAIETLLASRNGHKKEIRIMEGEYAPVTSQMETIPNPAHATNPALPATIDTKISAFVIDTKALNDKVITPSSFVDGSNNQKYFAQSITIKGGYSSEIPYEYDPAKYKTTIRQNESGDGSVTDYLIYIADPTIRYAYKEDNEGNSGYTEGNMYGAIGANDGEASEVKTMPIQVDGVTLINDLAASGTKGSAIYYPDYKDATAPAKTVDEAHSVNVGSEVTYYTDENMNVKSDAETEYYTTRIYYTDEGKTNLSPNNIPTSYFVESGESKPNPAKILITKTEVIGSGNKTSDNPAVASAVYIGKNGGPALIYNTVFHSNYGMPLDAWNTINVNNTFGMNAGLVRLQDTDNVKDASSHVVKSQIHNSALWKNNWNASKVNYDAQFVIPGVSVGTSNGEIVVTGDGISNFTYNSFTGGNVSHASGDVVVANKYNTGLTNDNTDLGSGPNFVDPENVDVFARNFDIKPSVRLLNKGMDESLTSGSGVYYTLVVNNKYDFSLASTTDKDALNRNRLNTPRIDIGAYEFQGSLLNILYVDPNKSHSDEATGENWEKAFGYGDLQDAVDLAAISHMTSPTQESYVFVKGNSSTNTGNNTNETLIIRDGVTVYGSIVSSYDDWHAIKKSDGVTSKYDTIKDFIDDMTSNREGVASNAASKTIVTGIKTSEFTEFKGQVIDETDPLNPVTYSTPALVDGFVVTNPEPTEPVVKLVNPSEDGVIVVRDVVVADNDMTMVSDVTNVNVAEVSNGLIYEVLMRDNKAKGNGVVLKVANTEENSSIKTRGFAVNVTVEGKTVDVDGNSLVDTDGGQIFNSITNSIETGAAKGAYGNIKNKGISGYFYNIADPNLNYQLTETSKYIDMCDGTVNPLNGVDGAENLVQFINYDTDRDILGNPRLLVGVTDGKLGDGANLLDRGAFETWKVDSRKVVSEVLKINEVKKQFFCGEQGTISQNGAYATGHDFIKKHFYPHDGSVVYIMEGNDLVIDAFDPTHEVKPTPHNPGFMLVKEGANFYGNGRPATCAYLAIERQVRKGGNIVAVPYAMNYDLSSSVAKVTNDGAGDLVLEGKIGKASQYSGDERMDWKYIFQTTATNCWDQISVANANQGVLFEPHGQWYDNGADANTEVTLRFTGKGANMTDYIYTEEGVSKTVILTKNDDAQSTNNGADFTDELDMGWNCFGIPYLVSDYKPYQKVSIGATPGDAEKNKVVENSSTGEYSMNIPHTLWLYYDGKLNSSSQQAAPDNSKVNGDGGYYSVKSWSSTYGDWHLASTATPCLWVGEGIFTQTATLDDTETLKFWLPVAPAMSAPSSAKSNRNVRYYVDTTGILDTDKAEGAELIATEYYTAGGARVNKPVRGVVTIIKKIYSNGVVNTSKLYIK